MFLVLGSRPPFLPPTAVLVKRNWKHPGQDLSSSLFTASWGPLRRRRVNFKLISIRSESDRIDIQLEIPGVALPTNPFRTGSNSNILFLPDRFQICPSLSGRALPGAPEMCLFGRRAKEKRRRHNAQQTLQARAILRRRPGWGSAGAIWLGQCRGSC